MFLSNFLAIGLAVAVIAAPASSTTKRTKKFRFAGVNESGAEFGSDNIPGVYGSLIK